MWLHNILDYQAREHSDADFAIHEARRLTYGEALAQTHCLSNALVMSNLQVGDRVAILAKNCLEYLLLFFAASKAGVVLVPLNYRLSPAAWCHILNDAQVQLLIAAEDYVNQVDTIRSQLHTIKQYITLGDAKAEDWQDYSLWVANQSTAFQHLDLPDNQPVYQIYTSGTTGSPKGVVVTHRAVIAHMFQVGFTLRIYPGERSLMVVPGFVAGCPNMILFQCVYGGGCLYVLTEFKASEVIRALGEDEIAVATLLPMMIQACLEADGNRVDHRYDTLRLIHYGSCPLPEKTLRQAITTFSCDFVQSYGMTEATTTLTFLSASDHQRALKEQPLLLRSVGRPTIGTEVRIVDSKGQEVPTGATGEIIARGPQLMQGYWNLPDASAKVLQDGWLHTGDAGTIDHTGYWYVKGRLREMIVSGDKIISPRDAEEVLYEHPAIAEATVIPVPDQHLGEVAKAIVVLHPGSIATEEELIAFCQKHLDKLECPHSVDFVAALPRNPTGKVLKHQLQEPYWSGHPIQF
jgi:acyl-CoA synthetase (AMP-forming)/AMP-acid ligase II